MLHNTTLHRVRAARARAGLTQLQLALRTRLSLSTLRNAERGLFTTATISAIARALGVSVDELIGRKAGAP
ncbi:MAG: helix-turn-helix transcriptional regulator [Myxococcus sp.]|nr:helix-turn-helix transcriptional regulator [Myxococcus sp.]